MQTRRVYIKPLIPAGNAFGWGRPHPQPYPYSKNDCCTLGSYVQPHADEAYYAIFADVANLHAPLPPSPPPSKRRRNLQNDDELETQVDIETSKEGRQLLWGSAGNVLEKAANDVADATKNAVTPYLPTRWGVSFVSPSYVADLIKQGSGTGFCNANHDIKCDIDDYGALIPLEGTVCDEQADCTITSQCSTPNLEWCTDTSPAAYPVSTQRNQRDDWAAPCTCGKLNPPEFYCNMDSHVCSAGKSPFQPPENAACPTGNITFIGSRDSNRLCYIVDAWRCAGENSSSIDTCLARLTLYGPRLCREFCDPTFENEGNSLRTYQMDPQSQTCVCQVGWGRLAFNPTDGDVLVMSS
ncbi:MAG: hypothetical protein QMC37_04570, partial [Flavobacteriales bacterium]